MTGNGHSTFIVGLPMEDVQHTPSPLLPLPASNSLPLPASNIQEQDEEFITIDQLHYLVRLIDQSDVVELEVMHGAQKARLLLRKAKSLATDVAQLEAPALTEGAGFHAKQTQHTITAPLVGIFQSWSSSKDKPLVSVGDTIKEGQHVGVIRLLDIPYEVETPVAGRVVEILVQDGQPVEYGQPLMTIDK